MSRKPKYITLEELNHRIISEEPRLGPDDVLVWQKYRVQPFVVHYGESSYYAVARNRNKVLVFFDDEDEFGSADLKPDNTIDHPGLSGDLVDAVYGLSLEKTE